MTERPLHPKILAPAIRRLVLADVAKFPQAFVRCEHGLNYGSVADVLVISDELHGVEIKSDGDTLARLTPPGGNQIRDYSAVFDRVTVVATRKHRDGLTSKIPSWWGIIVVDGEISFTRCRESLTNPALDPKALASLLWIDEMVPLGKALGVRRGSKREMATALSQAMSLDALRDAVRSALRGRDYHRERIAKQWGAA